MPRGQRQRVQVPEELTEALQEALTSNGLEGLSEDTREAIDSVLAGNTDKLNPAQLQKVLGQLLAAQNAEEASKKDAPKKKRERRVLGPKPAEAQHTWIPDHVLTHHNIHRPAAFKGQTFEEQQMLTNPIYIKHSRRVLGQDSGPGWNRKRDVAMGGRRT